MIAQFADAALVAQGAALRPTVVDELALGDLALALLDSLHHLGRRAKRLAQAG
jgi:hypothetical protein